MVCGPIEKLKGYLGWGNSLVVKVFALQIYDHEFRSLTLCRKTGVALCTCNSNTGKAEIGGSLSLPELRAQRETAGGGKGGKEEAV